MQRPPNNPFLGFQYTYANNSAQYPPVPNLTPIDEWERVDQADIVVNSEPVVRSPVAVHRAVEPQPEPVVPPRIPTPVPPPRAPSPEPVHIAIVDLAPEVEPGPEAPRAATPRPVTPPPPLVFSSAPVSAPRPPPEIAQKIKEFKDKERADMQRRLETAIAYRAEFR